MNIRIMKGLLLFYYYYYIFDFSSFFVVVAAGIYKRSDENGKPFRTNLYFDELKKMW